MKIRELKENEPLRVEKVTSHKTGYILPSPGKSNNKTEVTRHETEYVIPSPGKSNNKTKVAGHETEYVIPSPGKSNNQAKVTEHETEYILLSPGKSNNKAKVTRHETEYILPSPGKSNNKIKTITIELDQIETIIITDGEIEKRTEEVSQNINAYYFGKTKYQNDVDTLKVQNIYFKNHSYVITYLLAKEWIWMPNGHIEGLFDVIKDVSIYLENVKDKKALREAKRVIKRIYNYSNPDNYLSIWELLFKQYEGLEEISSDVYTLKKRK